MPHTEIETQQTRFGGITRGDSLANRQQGARNQIGRQGSSLGSTTRPGGVGDRGSFGNRSGISDGIGGGNRGSIGDRGGVGNRGGSIGSGDRVGNRSLGNRSSDRGAFGGYSRGSTRSSVSRGSSSMGETSCLVWNGSPVELSQTLSLNLV